MADADAASGRPARRVGLFGHFALWFAGGLVLPSLVVFLITLASRAPAESPELTPIALALYIAVFRLPWTLAHVFACLLCGTLIHGFSVRWRGAAWTLGCAGASALAMLLPDPFDPGRGFLLDDSLTIVPLALAPLLGVAMLKRGEPAAPLARRLGGAVIALAIGGGFAWEYGRAWWFAPRWRTLESTVKPVQEVIDEVVERPEFRPSWMGGSWGGRSDGLVVPRNGRHSRFSSEFRSGDVDVELRWDFDADRPELVVLGVDSAPAKALTERLREVAPQRGWTVLREIGDVR